VINLRSFTSIAAFLAIFAVAALTLQANAQSASGFTYNGLTLTSYQANEYNNSASAAATMRATGANYAAVMETQYQQTYTSNVIAPETTSSPGYTSSYPLSPTDTAVVNAIKAAQAQGLTVSLKPQVDSLDGVFRGNFAPSNPAAWFASYQTFILHYAQIASQNNVGMLVIGTELKSLTTATYKTYWETIISAIRNQYPGLTLVYGANATGAGDEFTSVSFWADVDIIGVDGYFPLTNQTDPSLAALIAAWTNNKSGFNIVSALKNLQSTYNKPLIFSEIGYVSVAGTNEQPYASVTGAYDPLEQQDCYEAFFEVFSAQSSWMKGVFWWDWTVSAPGANDTGYSPQNKSAGNVTLPKWFNSTTPGFTIAAAQSTVALGQGLAASDVISVTDQGGFAGAVTMTVSGLPSGVTGVFSAGTVAGTQILTLTAASNATLAGPVTVTVTGTSSGITSTTTIATTVVTATAQTITFANPGQQKLAATISLVGSSSSGLPIIFTSTTPTVCSVSSTTVTATMLTVGTCTLTASQGGSAIFSAAATVTDSFAVAALPTVSVPPSADVIVSQVNYLANVGGYMLSAGNPGGGSMGVNSHGMVVVANDVNIQLVNATTGALINLGAWGNSAAAAVDPNDNIYLGNSYGPVNSIVKLPYTGAATNGGYAPFTTPTTSTPLCTGTSTTECLLPANLGSINVASMAFDAAGDLFFITAGSGNTAGNSLYECVLTCLSGTGTPVLVYTEPTASPAPSASSGQLLIGSVAIDSAGNLFFTDSSIYTNLSTYAYYSFFSNLKELPTTTGAGFGGVTTGYAAAPLTLYTLNTPNPSAYGNQVNGAVVLRNGNGDTVYFADQYDQIFGFPDTSGGIPVLAGKPTALFTAANQGAIDLTIDSFGNLYPVAYSTATGSGGDTVAQVTTNAITVPTSPTGTATSPSTTTSPVTTILNDTTCSSTPGPSVTFTATPGSNASATITPSTSCSSTFNGNASFATTLSFTPTTAGADSVIFTDKDQSTNSGSVTVSGTGSGFTLTPASTSVTVPQTTSTTDAIMVADFGSFTGNVTLAATGLPAGVTAAFATNPVTSSSVLTFTASSTAAIAGPFNVTVTATSGALTATATIAVSVTAAPGFTLSSSSTSASIPQGNSATSTITVNQLSNFSGTVTLAATGLPTGVTAAFATNPTTTTSVLTLSASATAAAGGPVTVTITGTSGTMTATTSMAVTITAAASYKIAPTSGTVAITQGAGGTDTITVTPVNGFSSGVALAATGLPTGVTASFSPNPTTTSSSVLTLTAASTATVGGPVTVTITGTSGTLSQTTTIALTVNAAPGFTLAPSPTTVTINQGATATSTLTLTDVGGFSGSVTLAATGLPAGVTASYSVNPATATSIVTFTATSAATTGNATITITGTSGSLTSSTSIPLTVTPPASFTLASAPATLTVMQNGTASSTVTVTGAYGFSGPVTLAATGLPTGVTAAFATNPATGSSMVTFTAAGTAPTGTSTVTITGTSGTLTATTTIAVTTALGPNFNVTPTAAAVTIIQGATASDNLTITGLNGFSGMVTFTASGLPSGVTATFSTNPAAAATTLMLTATPGATAGGPVTVTITGTSGNITGSATVALTVNVPPSFTLVAAPAVVTVAQTTSITSTVTVTSIGGYTGTPTLAVTGLPTGVTATFAPGTAGTQILTLAASATAGATSATSAPPYNATLTITGTSGALTSSTTVALTIIGAPSFAINGPALVIKHGAGILNTSPLSIVATNGFSGTVALSCAITPAAASNPATCSLAPASVTLSGTTPQSSVLTITSTAGELVQNHPTPFGWLAGGSTAFAFVLFIGLPRRRRNWTAGLLILLLGVVSLGIVGCSSTPTYSSPVTGTSVGAYTVTITGTAGSTVATGSVSLTIQ
jgi:hypothetical protein